jgi:acyl dehydratase
VTEPEETSYLTPTVLNQIGIESEPYSMAIEKGDLMRFARATSEESPRFLDEVLARRSCAGGLTAVPTFLITMRELQSTALPISNPLPHSLDGGTQWDYFEPIRPGDIITARAHLAEVYERAGSLGRMLFQVVEVRYVNQLDQLVATQRDTYIRYG